MTLDNEKVAARKGHRITLAGEALDDEKFDVKATDPFYRWSARRAEYIAAANVTAARVASNSGYRSSYSGSGHGAWSWNPWFGMYTFLPASGVYWSPFGSAYYSPGMVSSLYFSNRPMWGRPAPAYAAGTRIRVGMPVVPMPVGPPSSRGPSAGLSPGAGGMGGARGTAGLGGGPAHGSGGPPRAAGH